MHSLHHYNSSPGLHGQYYGDIIEEEYIEGHPRHGDQGERQRIPSRMPSLSSSVDWELFRDYEGGASVAGSFSSRQGSFSDMPLPEGSNGGRRPSQSFASPSSFRHLGFQGRKLGSFSNDSFINESNNFNQMRNTSFGKSSESLRAAAQESFIQHNLSSAGSSSHSGSPRNFHKTHKKVKSTSSFGVPIIDPNSYSRRPSVPNNFYPPGAMPPVPPPLKSHNSGLLDFDSSQMLPMAGSSGYTNRNAAPPSKEYQYPGVPDPSQPKLDQEFITSPGGSQYSTSRPIDLPSPRQKRE
jgi:hypothetical protein